MKEQALSMLNEFIEYEGLKGYTEGTLLRKRNNVQRFLEYVHYCCKTVTDNVIESYMNNLAEKEISPERINLFLTHIRQFYDYLLDTDKVLLNPAAAIEGLPVYREDISFVFTEEEIKSLFESSSTHCHRKSLVIMARDRAILELLYSTGIRASELVNLDADDISSETGEVIVCKAKGDSQRIVPVGEEALKALGKYLTLRPKLLKDSHELEALFISRQGNRLRDVSVRRLIERRKVESEISSKGSTHTFRRSCATHMLRHGAPLATLQRLLGHKSITSTESYTPVGSEDLREVYRRSHPGA